MLTGENGEVQFYGYLLIEIWDHDKVNQDDYLGRLVIPLCDIVPGHSGEVWYPITRKGVKDTVSGRIKVKLSLHLEEEMVSVYTDLLFISFLTLSLSPLSPSHRHSPYCHPLTVTLPTVTLSPSLSPLSPSHPHRLWTTPVSMTSCTRPARLAATSCQ